VGPPPGNVPPDKAPSPYVGPVNPPRKALGGPPAFSFPPKAAEAQETNPARLFPLPIDLVAAVPSADATRGVPPPPLAQSLFGTKGFWVPRFAGFASP